MSGAAPAPKWTPGVLNLTIFGHANPVLLKNSVLYRFHLIGGQPGGGFFSRILAVMAYSRIPVALVDPAPVRAAKGPGSQLPFQKVDSYFLLGRACTVHELYGHTFLVLVFS